MMYDVLMCSGNKELEFVLVRQTAFFVYAIYFALPKSFYYEIRVSVCAVGRLQFLFYRDKKLK